MANTNIEAEELTTGVRLSVIVEYYLENIIAVYLVHNGKEYRGVLLETDTGFFPHGIPFYSKPAVEQKASVKSSPRSALDIKPGMENKPPDLNSYKDVKFELSASVCRFSYNTNPFLNNPRPVPDTPTVEMKPVTLRRKTVRDIRLRPRQTLCFKCKAAIHESHKNHISQGNSHSTATSPASKLMPPNASTCRSSADIAHSSFPLPPVTRKRKKSLQSPMVLLEDIQLKPSKASQEINSKEHNNIGDSPLQNPSRDVRRSNSGNKLSDFGNRKPVNAKARSHRSSSSGSINAGSDLLQIIDDSESSKVNSFSSKSSKKKFMFSPTCNAKPSPAIKITIGDGAIIKIPPRLPDKGADHIDDELPIPKLKILDSSGPMEYHTHKKAKKAAKKAKDRDKYKSSASRAESYTDMKQSEVVPSKSQKKHKKKHRHRHESPVHPYSEDTLQVPSELKKIRINNILLPPNKEEDEEEQIDLGIDSASLCGDAENYENTLPVVDNISKPRPRLVYTWRQNQGLSRVSSSPRDPVPSVSPKYLIKSSPSIIPIGSSPHRRKNASPARVVSASPNWNFAPSPKRMLKDYPLQNMNDSPFSSSRMNDSPFSSSRMNDSTYSSSRIPEPMQSSDYGIMQTSEDSQSRSSEADSHLSDFSDDSGDDCIDDFFPGPQSPPREEEDKDIIKPLMMKIQTQNVDGCVLEEGREIRVGDIVWGKIQGFPWWPGRVSNITVTQRDNDVVITQVANVAWFGSNTVSHMHCSDLFPFLEDFKARYNKKKKGQYRLAIKQATSAAQRLAAESHREFLIEDYEL